MNNINKHLLNDLFINKSVKYQKSIYLKYYFEIWNDDSNYIKFLNSTSETLQRECAKEIISRTNFSSDFIVPSFIFNGLIEDEIKEFSDPNGSYQGQTHYVHSVMMYILGIWIYFNHPVFHKYINIQLNNEFEKKDCNKEFIVLWKNISLIHDLGYVFENNVDIEKHCKEEKFEKYFSKYNFIDLYVLYELTLKSVSNLVFIEMIANRSKECLADAVIRDTKTLFLSNTKAEFTIEEIFKSLDLEDYKKLWMVSTYDEYKSFEFLNYYLKPIIIARDIDNNIVYIKSNNNTNYFSEKNIDIEDIFNNCSFEFYCYNPQNVVKDFLNHFCNKSHTYEYFLELVDDLSNEYSFDFTISIDKSLQEKFRYTIFKKLKDEFSFEDFTIEGNFIISDEIEIKEISKNAILSECKRILESVELEMDSNIPLAMYKYLCNSINNNNIEKNIVNLIVEKDNSSLKSKIKLFISYYKNCKSLLNTELISKTITSNDEYNVKIDYDLFSNKSTDTNYINNELNKLKEYITKKGIQTGIIDNNTNFNNLLNYHHTNSIYDHGITSSSILFHTSTINKMIIEQRHSQFPILLSLFSDSFNPNLYDKINFISVYAIIMHNLYPSIYGKLFGKNFILDLQSNPISYFLAFCDNLQQWDRPKTIDYSRTEIKGDYIVGSSFDLDIIDNRIYLHCNTSSLKNIIEKNRDVLNQYLKDAAKFIKLELKEQ